MEVHNQVQGLHGVHVPVLHGAGVHKDQVGGVYRDLLWVQGQSARW